MLWEECYISSSSSSSSALQPWVGLGLLLRFRNNIFFMGWGCWPHAQRPTWGARVSLFVWVITLDLSGMGGPTSSIRYCQQSSRDHLTTQAPPLRQSRDTFGGNVTFTAVNITASWAFNLFGFILSRGSILDRFYTYCFTRADCK
jgi:hypothetical protein